MLTPTEMALIWMLLLFEFLWTYVRPLSMGCPESDDTTAHPHKASESDLHDP